VKKLLNTLFVTTQGAYLAKERETILVRIEKKTRLQLPIHTLGGIVCFGQVSASPALMGFCGERNVGLSFFSERGRFLARVEGPVSGNVLLRRAQYRKADDLNQSAEIARLLVAAKTVNSRRVLLRALRDQPGRAGAAAIESAINKMRILLQRLQNPELSLNVIRGFEGEAAKHYFGAFDGLVSGDRDGFGFRGRNRRPPRDNINSLLSFLYTLLAHDVAAALEGVGLDPGVGYLHRDRPGRAGLALDLMEEFRAYLADRLALSLINRRQISAKGFVTTESGAVTMTDNTRKTVLVAWQERKQDELMHPFLNEKLAIGLLPHAQAMLMARYLRGDLDQYPPFVFK